MKRTEIIEHLRAIKEEEGIRILGNYPCTYGKDVRALEYCLDILQPTFPSKSYLENMELTTICDCHNMIRSIVAQTKEELDPESAESEWLTARLQEIYDIAGMALIMGQSMEDRLETYYEGIHSLGFERMREKI